MRNILSIDLEDWYQLIHRRVSGETPAAAKSVFRQLDVFLENLAKHNTTATFFTVGMLAEQYPELVKRASAAGHEIACHGYDHLMVYSLTPEEFRADTQRAKQVLEDMTGKPVVGFRAPEFSILRRSIWALEVLAELGFVYDSSIFPIRHRRYGIPGFDRHPRRYSLPNGKQIVEFPLSSVRMGGVAVPVAGGGYFRLTPLTLLKRAIVRLNSEGLPLVTYFHPYEFDGEALNVFSVLKPRGAKQQLRARLLNRHQNLGRSTMPGKLDGLLSSFSFCTFQSYLANEGKELQSGNLATFKSEDGTGEGAGRA